MGADEFTNGPLANLDAPSKFASEEFTTRAQRKFSLPLTSLEHHVGEPFMTNRKWLCVDPYGRSTAAARCLWRPPADHSRRFCREGGPRQRNWYSRAITACVGGFGSVQGIFRKIINQGDDLLPKDLNFRRTSLAKTVEALAQRAGRIDSDIAKAATALDKKYPGSTVLKTSV